MRPEVPAPERYKNLPSLHPTLLDPHGAASYAPTFPGVNGIPWKGPKEFRKETDFEPAVGFETHVAIFDLSKEDELRYYEGVWQLVSNGLAEVSPEEKVYDADTKNWRVFLRWKTAYATSSNQQRGV